jgi:hypothetical protein
MKAPALTKPKPTLGPREDLASSARMALIISVIATLVLFRTPGLHFIAYPLMLLSTLVHEMGHGVGGLLAGGEWIDFHMFKDGSGYARAWAPTNFGTGLIGSAGLVGPALIAAVYLVVGQRPRLARITLGATGVFFALSLILWVRGGFGITFVASVAAICIAIAVLSSAETSRLVLLFLATQLALSAYSRGDYLFEDYVDGQMSNGKRVASDVQIMSDAIGGPYWFWGILCGAFSIAVIAFGAWLYLRPTKRAPKTV